MPRVWAPCPSPVCIRVNVKNNLSAIYFFTPFIAAMMDKLKTAPAPTKPNGVVFADRLPAFASWAAEFCSAVLIIFCNKALMQKMGFRFPVTLTALHFACTALVARASMFLGKHVRTVTAVPSSADVLGCDQELQCLQGQDRPVDIKASSGSSGHPPNELHTTITRLELVCFAGISSLAIVMSNLSLCSNSVAFYQITKLPVLVFVAALEAAMGVKKYNAWQCAGVIFILSGVAATIHGNFSTSGLGVIVALGSILSTGMHQLLCGRLQAWHGLSASELLAKVSPIKATILALVGPLLDRTLLNSDLRKVDWTFTLVLVVGATCCLAAILNISQYAVIRCLGAGLYQALSQLKTIFIVVLGSFLFDAVLNLWQLGGAGVAVWGVYLLLHT